MNSTQQLLLFGIFELNLDTEELRRSGNPIKLPPQSLRLLMMLARRAGQVVTREEIRERFWDRETTVDFERRMNQCIQQIRTALSDTAGNPLYVETIPRQGYRFIAPVESRSIPSPGPRMAEADSVEGPVAVAQRGATAPGDTAHGHLAAVLEKEAEAAAGPAIEAANFRSPRPKGQRTRLAWIGVAAALLALIGAGLYWRAHRGRALSGKDTIVLADFENRTGDPVFDQTLKGALAIDLEQSPFLNLLSDQKVSETLKLMNRPAHEKLTQELAGEVCLRTNSKALLSGSISQFGSEYVIGLKAVNCQTGDTLVEEQAKAAAKEKILKAIDKLSAGVRQKLGESLPSVQKFATPLEDVTTPSLEALQAFTTGKNMKLQNGDVMALPYFRLALDLDPNFVLAYVELGRANSNLEQTSLAVQYFKKAYELRDRVSLRERHTIEAYYYLYVTGELEKARQTYIAWSESYPSDYVPHHSLGNIYSQLQRWDDAMAEEQEALRLRPDFGVGYANLMASYVRLNRLGEAKALFDEALRRGLDNEWLRQIRYSVAFIEGDQAAMQEQLKWAADKPGVEDHFLAVLADTEAYYGRLDRARELSEQAVDSAVHANKLETAGRWKADEALREAEVGDTRRAQEMAAEALALSTGKDVTALTALTLARAGEVTRAKKLAEDLDRNFPLATIMQNYTLPTIRAAIDLRNNQPVRAIQTLAIVTPYESNSGSLPYFCPAYIRGQAYLALGQGQQAAGEFQKVIDHQGIVTNFVIRALARLQLGRAQVVTGDNQAALKSYQDFLTLWNDADPDIPIYQQAKAEYGRLQ